MFSYAESDITDRDTEIYMKMDKLSLCPVITEIGSNYIRFQKYWHKLSAEKNKKIYRNLIKDSLRKLHNNGILLINIRPDNIVIDGKRDAKDIRFINIKDAKYDYEWKKSDTYKWLSKNVDTLEEHKNIELAKIDFICDYSPYVVTVSCPQGAR